MSWALPTVATDSDPRDGYVYQHSQAAGSHVKVGPRRGPSVVSQNSASVFSSAHFLRVRARSRIPNKCFAFPEDR